MDGKVGMAAGIMEEGCGRLENLGDGLRLEWFLGQNDGCGNFVEWDPQKMAECGLGNMWKWLHNF